MCDGFVSIPINDGKNICVSTIDRDGYEAAGVSNIGDDYGVFVYETSIDRPDAEIEILAKAVSREAADKLVRLLEAAHRALGANRPIERSADDQ
jgi:hypothetical protein